MKLENLLFYYFVKIYISLKTFQSLSKDHHQLKTNVKIIFSFNWKTVILIKNYRKLDCLYQKI